MTDAEKRFRLDGKSALVTAAAGAFGSAIARGLAEAGADVCATDVRADEVLRVAEDVRARGRRALGFGCDVASPEQITSAVERVVGEWGRLDVLVNVACAAVLRP